MNDDKAGEEINSEFDQKKGKVVELPILDFFKINIISFLVPLYACLGLFLLFEYGFIITFSIPLAIHFLILPVLLLVLYYIYLLLLIEFTALWTRRWNKKSPPVEGVFKRVLDDKDSADFRCV